jgi:hypothetical protein
MKKLLSITIVLATVAGAAHAADFGPNDIQRAIDTYRANELRFTRDFVGRSIEFTWVFRNASSRYFGSGYRVTIGNGSFNGNVDCVVTDQTMLDKIVEWNKGQRVKVYGVIKDVTMGDLQLKECNIIAL